MNYKYFFCNERLQPHSRQSPLSSGSRRRLEGRPVIHCIPFSRAARVEGGHSKRRSKQIRKLNDLNTRRKKRRRSRFRFLEMALFNLNDVGTTRAFAYDEATLLVSRSVEMVGVSAPSGQLEEEVSLLLVLVQDLHAFLHAQSPGRYTARTPMTSASFKKLFFYNFPELADMVRSPPPRGYHGSSK